MIFARPTGKQRAPMRRILFTATAAAAPIGVLGLLLGAELGVGRARHAAQTREREPLVGQEQQTEADADRGLDRLQSEAVGDADVVRNSVADEGGGEREADEGFTGGGSCEERKSREGSAQVFLDTKRGRARVWERSSAVVATIWKSIDAVRSLSIGLAVSASGKGVANGESRPTGEGL